MPTKRIWISLLALVALAVAGDLAAVDAKPIPVILDTDIGTDIDDAYALAQVLHSPELKLLGVTTVSGDAVARARLAAKLLVVAGRSEIPVYAGTSTAPQYIAQTERAKDFSSPALHLNGGVEFLRQQINAHPGEIILIAIGELTNIAAVLASEPGIGAKIKAIALMGGSVRRGYAQGSALEPEWNIKSNAAAARTVFTSGVPLLVAPLDSTSDLKLTPEWRVKIFARGTPLNDALASLDFIWRHTNTWKGDIPTLFDELAVHPPNAQVALTSKPAEFLEYFTRRLAH